jgi:hypothetical protein
MRSAPRVKDLQDFILVPVQAAYLQRSDKCNEIFPDDLKPQPNQILDRAYEQSVVGHQVCAKPFCRAGFVVKWQGSRWPPS